jgi:UMP-CMP kinase
MGKQGGMGVCPFSLFLFAATTGATLWSLQQAKTSKKSESTTSDTLPPCTVIFVVGAPGTGKGTQCQLLIERTNGAWVHLSAGDLLRDERKRAQAAKEGKSDGGDLELANTIENCINAGKLVPSSITVRLLEKGMIQAYQTSGCTQFLLDGFPRGQDNIDAWDQQMGGKHKVTCVLNFDAPEEVLVGRLLERGKSSGRSDDNIETIRKRFQTHVEACKPVLERYGKDGVLESIGSDRPVQEIYQQVEQIVLGNKNRTLQ